MCSANQLPAHTQLYQCLHLAFQASGDVLCDTLAMVSLRALTSANLPEVSGTTGFVSVYLTSLP